MDNGGGHGGQWSLPRFNVVLFVAVWVVPCGVSEVIHLIIENYATLVGANQASKTVEINLFIYFFFYLCIGICSSA